VYLVDDTPKSIAEAYASPNADDWKEAIQNEMDSILLMEHESYLSALWL
jgi:hypothetical protein